jgi:uncharacterized protein (TIGR02453 family)
VAERKTQTKAAKSAPVKILPQVNPHFSEESLKFLRALKRNNRREWFDPRKPLFEAILKAPMLKVIERLTAAMMDFSPEHVRPAPKIMMRIYRDTRFSNDKTPYKTRVAAWWSRHGLEKTSGGGYYMHIHPTHVLISIGVYMPERDQLLAIRRWMADHHTEYRALLKSLTKSRAGSQPFTNIDAEALTRMPKGFPNDHSADELLRAKNWGVHISLPAEIALEPTLGKEIIKRFRLATPLVNALNGAILTGTKPESSHSLEGPTSIRKPLF